MKSIMSFLILIFSVFCSCSNGSDQENFSTDLNRLKKHVNIVKEPKNVKWLIVKMGTNNLIGPSDYVIYAVLDYTNLKNEDLDFLHENKDKSIHENVYLNRDSYKDWYPQPIKESFYLEGEYYRISEPVFSPSKFSNGTLNNGFYFIKNNYVLIMISS